MHEFSGDKFEKNERSFNSIKMNLGHKFDFVGLVHRIMFVLSEFSLIVFRHFRVIIMCFD